MAIELKEVADFLFDKEDGVEIDKLESTDQLKDAFHKKYVSRQIAIEDEDIKSKVTGKVLGTLDTKVRRAFELTEDEAKGKKVSELIELGEAKVKAKVEELQAKIKNGKTDGDDEAVKKLQDELSETKRRAKEFETVAAESVNQVNILKETHQKELQGFEVNFKLSNLKAEITWADSANVFAKKGWENHIAENYTFAMNDGKLIVTDKEGNQIKNDNGTGFISPKDLLTKEADKAGLIKKAGAAGGAANQQTKREERRDDGQQPTRHAHPRYNGAQA